MPDSEKTAQSVRGLRKVLTWLIAAVVGFCLVLSLALKVYLATPQAAGEVSRLLSSYLHYPVKVAGLHTAGDTLYLKGLSVANPSGFPAGHLVVIDSAAISPQWLELLRGARRFRLVELAGLRVDLRRNGSGEWNFAGLKRLGAGKKPGAETFLESLVVRDGALRVNGRGIEGVALRLTDLSTRGTGESGLTLSFRDDAGNPFRIDGKVRPGAEPTLDLALEAPSLSLKGYAGLLKKEGLIDLQQGRGELRAAVTLRGGRLKATGRLACERLSARLGKGELPLAGELRIAAEYDLHRDELRLKNLTLVAARLITVRAAGTCSGLRKERRFTADIGFDDVDLARLSPLLTEREQRLALGGRVAASGVRLSGDGARGVTGISGSLSLREGALALGDRLLVAGLSGRLDLAREERGIAVKGRLSQEGPSRKGTVESLDATFSAFFSERLKPLLAEAPSLSARVMGVPVTGRLAFTPLSATPFAASLRVPSSSLTGFNTLLERQNLRLASGTGLLSVEVSGRGAREFSGTATARLAGVKGKRGEKGFSLGEGGLQSRFAGTGGRLEASGDLRLEGLSLDGKGGSGRLSFRLADGTVAIENGAFNLDGTKVTVARAAGRIPAREAGLNGARYPLSLEAGGLSIRRGDAEVTGLSGTLRGTYVAAPGGGWLEGGAVVSSGGVSWRGKAVVSPSARLSFARSGWRGELGGALLGGTMSGEVGFNPLNPGEGTTFRLGLKGIRLAEAAGLAPRKEGATLSDGLLDATCSGRYAPREGLSCRFDGRGDGIAMTGRGGKSILAGGGVRVSGGITGGRLSLADAVVTVGNGVALRLKGEVGNAFASQREGQVAFTLAKTQLASLVDPFVNLLPRFLQEATTGGTVAAEGSLAFGAGRTLLEGALALDGVSVENQTQRLTVADVGGRVPFSLDFTGKREARPHEELSFTRGNFPKLIERLRQAPPAQERLRIGKVRFGPLEMGESTLDIRVGKGTTEIVSLKSGLYEGKILGRGFVTVKGGIEYGGDFLVDDLSLRSFCDQFPKIKGYISGRLDGIVSLYGEGKGMSGLSGFTDLWTRGIPRERMRVSKEFLQKLAGKKLKGFFFRNDRDYDQAEISAYLEEGYLTFETLDITHTNIFGVRDLSVSVAPAQNRIALEHLFEAVKQAAARGKAVSGGEAPPGAPAEAPPATEFKWEE